MTQAPDTAPIRPGEELNVAALREYLRGKVPGDVDALEVEQFPGGSSNLTYLVRLGERELVLRRAPLGPVAPKAHDMVREYHLLQRVHPVFPQAPEVVLLCEDQGVIGATFYLMERRHGVVIRRDMPAEFQGVLDAPRRASEALVDTLADLHAVDIQATGLIDIGKPDGFLGRQVDGWAGRWERAQTDDVPEAPGVTQWLRGNLPRPQGATIVHNDYKLDNVMLDPTDPGRVVAVLDWEMTTVGDPLVDLGLTLTYWTQRGFPPQVRTRIGAPHADQGWFTREQLLERYAQRTGRDVTDMVWYEVLGVFKLAVIVQQIYYRYHKGQTQDPRFAVLGEQANNLIREAARQIEAGGQGRP